MTLVHHEALLRHFAELRDGRHGDAVDRAGKEKLFGVAVELLDPVARRVLGELADDLLLGAGEVTATGVVRSVDGGLVARWLLGWPEQERAGVAPVTVRAHFGREFLHPHLGGATVGEWPLNVFDAAQAEAETVTLRAIAAAELHNLVFQADYRIVPATTA